jgi:hypothetical protein
MKRPWFQPLYFDNIDLSTVALTNSANRFQAMLNFCQQYFGDDLSEKTFTDLGCSIGYFMKQMSNHCKDVSGVESNSEFIRISKMLLPEISEKIIHGNIFTTVAELPISNIFSCLNVIDSIRLGSFDIFPDQNDELITLKTIDEKTEDVFFFQMIQQVQDDDEVATFLLDNTSFKFCKSIFTSKPKIIVDNSLTKDEEVIEENMAKFVNTLFALYRREV